MDVLGLSGSLSSSFTVAGSLPEPRVYDLSSLARSLAPGTLASASQTLGFQVVLHTSKAFMRALGIQTLALVLTRQESTLLAMPSGQPGKLKFLIRANTLGVHRNGYESNPHHSHKALAPYETPPHPPLVLGMDVCFTTESCPLP